MRILVSVIITTYDRPANLQVALNSVINQTYKNLQIIVIDGKGLEETQEMMREFRAKDDRIQYIYASDPINKTTLYGNVQSARNIALGYATGKYVAMLDDDDYWEQDKIALQLLHAKILDAALVSCYMKIKDKKNTYIDKPKIFPHYEDLLKNFNMSCTSSYFLNREVLNSIGGFNENLRSMHEYDIALRLSSLGHIIYVFPKPLMTMVRNNAKDRKFYYMKIAEVFDLYRFYGHNMLIYLGAKGFAFNVVKSVLLVTMFLLGFIIKERVWGIIFKLKNWYQEA